MATVGCVLYLQPRPALDALTHVAKLIAETHGPDAATAWFDRALAVTDIDLFFETVTTSVSPSLRLVTGGKA